MILQIKWIFLPKKTWSKCWYSHEDCPINFQRTPEKTELKTTAMYLNAGLWPWNSQDSFCIQPFLFQTWKQLWSKRANHHEKATIVQPNSKHRIDNNKRYKMNLPLVKSVEPGCLKEAFDHFPAKCQVELQKVCGLQEKPLIFKTISSLKQNKNLNK